MERRKSIYREPTVGQSATDRTVGQSARTESASPTTADDRQTESKNEMRPKNYGDGNRHNSPGPTWALAPKAKFKIHAQNVTYLNNIQNVWIKRRLEEIAKCSIFKSTVQFNILNYS